MKMKINAVTIKITLSSSLALLGVLFAILNGGTSVWFAAGMLFSWFGDMTLAECKPICRWTKNIFAGGMGLFALAHMCYISGLFQIISAAGFNGGIVVIPFIVLWVILMFAIWRLILRVSSEPLALKIAGLFYISLVGFIAATGISLAAHSIVMWPLACGGVLFLISDVVLGTHELGKRKIPLYGVIVWATYAPAQFFLLYGAFTLG